MENTMFKRVVASGLVLLHVWTMQAWAATTCSSTSSTGSVLSVVGDSKITNANGACNLKFYVSSVGAESGNLVTDSDTSTSGGTCRTYSTTTGAVTSTAVSASGTSASARTLDTFETSTSTFSIDIPTSSSISYGTKTVYTYWTAYSSSTNTNSNGSYTLTSGSTSVTVIKSGSTFTIPGGDYDYVSASNGASIVFSGPVRINKLSIGNNGTVTFAPDSTASTPSTNYIGVLSLSAATGIKVSGSSGTATLNILGIDSSGTTVGLTIYSNSCINYTTCTVGSVSGSVSVTDMAAQDASRLQINLYNGTLTTQGSFRVAAGIYVANGGIDFGNGSPVTVVGEVVANGNITFQNNTDTQLYYQEISSSTLQTGAYSLTPPVGDKVLLSDGSYGLKAGAYVYRTLQRDYRSDNVTAGTSGHLGKFKLLEDTTQEAVSGWDAADSSLNTLTDRAAKIYTDNTTGSDFILLTGASSSLFTDGTNTSSAECIINPACSDGAYLNGRDPDSLVGTPWRTYPIIVGDSVLFATDDGILYSVSKDTGKLNWGWIPRQIIPLTATQTYLTSKHPWGQITSVTLSKQNSSGAWVDHTYVTGTALGGQLHFSIEVGTDGSTLKSVVWDDYRSGQYSPGSDTWGGYAGRPYGGAAPVERSDSSGYVAYVVNNELVTRKVDDSTSSPTDKAIAWLAADRTVSGSPDFTAVASNLIYLSNSAIYFGGTEGRVWQMNSSGNLKTGAVNVSLGLTEPITFVNGATTVSTSGNGLVLLAQSTSRVTALKYLNEAWTLKWYTSVGASSSGTVPYIPTANNAYLSGPTDIYYANGQANVVLYYTTKDSTGCDVKGYAFGPIALEDGSGSATSTYIGPGEAIGGFITLWQKSDGTILSGVLAATAGTKTGTSTDSSSSSGSSSSTATLTTDAETIFIGGSTSSTSQRLNWREMTNFF